MEKRQSLSRELRDREHLQELGLWILKKPKKIEYPPGGRDKAVTL